MKRPTTVLAFLAALLLPISPFAGTLDLSLQRRDPETGEVRVSVVPVDPRRVGVVIVDMWNWHWCKTATARVAALVPRMQHVVAEARQLGMTIFWCPSDVADNYVGTPPYENAFNARSWPMPELRELTCPPAPDGGGCTCGEERCQGNYGWDGMHPDLVMADADLMPNDVETLYSLCRERGLTDLIYLGVHTQICLLGKSIGLKNLTRAGFRCILARDLTDAHAKYDPAAGITPDGFTADVVAHFERHLAPTIDFADELRRAHRWQDDWIVDPVRVTPWGTWGRPHFFTDQVTVTLSLPWRSNVVFRYTLDGTEPSVTSTRYSAPVVLRGTTRLRTVGFEDGRRVTLASEAFFARLPPRPPLPEVPLSRVKQLRVAGPGHSPSSKDHYFSLGTQGPQTNRNNQGGPLRIRRETFDQGLGVHAPNQLVYELRPEFGRFVAMGGADDQIHDDRHAANVGRYPSLQFKVLVDGNVLAESPVMRPGEPAWRFDVALPEGSRRLSLVTSDAGDGNRGDMGDWVAAGFLRR